MVIPAGYAQVNMIFTGVGLPRGAQMTFGIDCSFAGLTPTSVGNQVITRWTNELNNQISDAVTLTGVLVKFGPNSTGPAALVPASVPGALAVQSDSPNVAVLVRKNTAMGGRRGQGRCFLPGIPEASTSNGGLVTSTQLSLIQGDWNTFYNAMITANMPLYLLGADSVVPPRLITGFTVQALMATQRRRLRKVGGRRSAP